MIWPRYSGTDAGPGPPCDDNLIGDVSPLTDLPNLSWLHVEENLITDISPLVENEGFAQGDTLYLTDNPLDCEDVTVQEQLSTLDARGVEVTHDCD